MLCPACGKEIANESVACNFCGKPLQRPRRTPWLTILCVGILVLIVIGVIAGKFTTNSTRNEHHPGQPVAPTRTLYVTPHQDTLIGERFTVNAGAFTSRDFTITDQMEEARLVGKFEASGGQGDNIAVCVATADEFRNWINGNQANVFYTRMATVDSFNVGPLAPGKYTIGFSNKHAILFSRNVNAQVTLHYTTREYR